ncbi:DUF805 domain-containing protein [Litchfieldia alkalitelluris]|uniref:DUF805 domain-containing protein n=1 Tax=Litchfieldia alkalitelluris TaxID=304268 RepID=UPI0009985BE4|nr:DUF805 domain-containing protein [Litchfieldia alkalitelluris]
MQWYVKVIQNYVNFDGRARRMEYWMFYLMNFLISLGLVMIEGIMGLPGIFTGLYSLFILLPSIAVTVRRLHDTGKSGWWFFISFIPIIGAIILLIFMIIEGEHGYNNYGHDPKEEA